MRCEQARYWLLEGGDRRLTRSQQQALQSHLAQCDACREDQAMVEATTRLLNGWQEVSPPRWQRPVNLPVKPRSPYWVPWIPAVVGVLLMGLALSQARIQTHEHGVSIAFGAPQVGATMTAEELQLAEQRLTQQMEDLESQVRAHLEALSLANLEAQHGILSHVQSLQDRARLERREELADFHLLWQKQRERDLKAMADRQQFLHQGQIKTRDALLALARHMEH